MKFIAKTFAGLEQATAAELAQIGGNDIQVIKRAVSFSGDMELLYKANYYCRTILRIVMPLAEFEFATNEQFYRSVFDIHFEDYLDKEGSFCVHSVIRESIFSNSQYTSLLTKDAICDRFRYLYNCRPDVDKDNPDVTIDVHIYRNKATVSLDTSGISLHRRGYKTTRHNAALNEVLAAGLIALSGWQCDCNLVDFMCGSGTILIEAAMKALNMPSGYYRTEGYGFMTWKNFDEALWQQVRNQLDDAMHEEWNYKIYGSDINGRYVKSCRENVEQLRLDDIIVLSLEAFEDTRPEQTPAFVISNPPYGERLKIEEINQFYQSIGDTLKKHYTGCKAGIITPNKQVMKQFGLHASQKFVVYNAELECCFYLFDIYSGSKKSKYN